MSNLKLKPRPTQLLKEMSYTISDKTSLTSCQSIAFWLGCIYLLPTKGPFYVLIKLSRKSKDEQDKIIIQDGVDKMLITVVEVEVCQFEQQIFNMLADHAMPCHVPNFQSKVQTLKKPWNEVYTLSFALLCLEYFMKSSIPVKTVLSAAFIQKHRSSLFILTISHHNVGVS